VIYSPLSPWCPGLEAQFEMWGISGTEVVESPKNR
jgi:hypothetical protein